MRRVLMVCGVIAALGCSSGDDDSGANDEGTGGSGFGTGGTYVPMTGSGGTPAGSGGMTASSGSGGMSSPTSSGSGGSSTMQNPGTGGSTSPAQDSGMMDSGSGGSSGSDAGNDAAQDSGPPLTPTEGLIGWASEQGDGDDTTTGGMGGQEVTATSAQQLMDYASSGDTLVIKIQGTISVPRLEVASNKTLLGVGSDATIQGGLRIRGDSGALVHNVIVQNLHINGASSDVDGDAVQIHYAHHVWVDHCEIWDGADGNLDIVHASNWVTVSWTKFHYTSNAPDQQHKFCNLIGHSDSNASEDTGRLKVTFHHNWWAEGPIERMPRVRFGQVHVFNNYYSAAGNNYAVGAALEARVRVENNVFDGVNHPHIFYDGESTAQMVAEGNLYMGASASNPSEGQQSGQGAAFDPPYDYTLEPASGVEALVKANAGPQ